MNTKRKKYIVIIVLIAAAVATAVLGLIAPNYIDNLLIFMVGGAMCWIAVDTTVTTYGCREKVTALFVDYGFEQYKAHVTSSPIFTYTYRGRQYTEESAECLSQRYALKHFRKGATYTVYISAKNPALVKIGRRMRLWDALLLLLGLAVMTLSVVSVFL